MLQIQCIERLKDLKNLSTDENWLRYLEKLDDFLDVKIAKHPLKLDRDWVIKELNSIHLYSENI